MICNMEQNDAQDEDIKGLRNCWHSSWISMRLGRLVYYEPGTTSPGQELHERLQEKSALQYLHLLECSDQVCRPH